jgi:acyl-CoA thioester hydrolase
MVDEHGVDAVVAEATMRFLKPLRFDEDVELLVGVADVGNTSMTIGFAVERDGERCAEGENRYVYIDPAQSGTTPVPGAVREALSEFSAP